MVESMRYVRTYPAELPVLRDLLPQIQIPVQIVAGRHDPAVPTVNAEFLHQRLRYSKLDIIDAGTSPGRTRPMSTRPSSPPGGAEAMRSPDRAAAH